MRLPVVVPVRTRYFSTSARRFKRLRDGEAKPRRCIFDQAAVAGIWHHAVKETVC